MANVQMIKQVFTSSTGILMFPDNYQAKPHTFDPTDATAVVVGTKKVIKAGTVYPTNDANAKGIVLYDVDVTSGTGTGVFSSKEVLNFRSCQLHPLRQQKPLFRAYRSFKLFQKLNCRGIKVCLAFMNL